MRIPALVLLVMTLGQVQNLRAQTATSAAHEAAKGEGAVSLIASKMAGSRIPCIDGRAGSFSCSNVDLLSFLPIGDLGGREGTRLNDIWGWTDPETGREYALVGRTDGMAIVDVGDPINPVYIGSLPAVGGASSSWRDIKTMSHYALVVMDHPSGGVQHGLQVLDLNLLREITVTPQTFDETAHYLEFRRAHNIVVNEESAFAYAVGSEMCGGGLHMIDVRDPLNPKFAGCYGNSGYTHDAQCVNYRGPDEEYQGSEICVGSNASKLVIADVSDKSTVVPISSTDYPDVQYTHQSWLTPDHRYVLIDDELDELRDDNVLTTRTLIFDVEDLDDPQLLTEYMSSVTSTDHNQYVRGDRAFQANYTSGLRILDLSKIDEPREAGFFDTYPANDDPGFQGAWSNYPFFESGIVIVSSIGEGLFVLDPTRAVETIADESAVPESFQLLAAYPNPFNPATTIQLEVDQPQHVRVAAFDVQGREVAVLHDGFIDAAGVREFAFDAADLASGIYVVRAEGTISRGSVTVTLQK